MHPIRAPLAEFIGTFTLVFLGAGAGALAGAEQSGGGLVAVALAHAFALVFIIYTWGHISGAHVNPAVTLATLVTGKVGVVQAVTYWIAQILGGLAAAFLLRWLLGGVLEGALGETIGKLTPTDTNPGDALKTIVVEGVLTFFLVCAVFSSGVFGLNDKLSGVAIGLVLAGDILMGGWLTGASMNPARTLGPAVAMANTSYVWLYFVGPCAGAAAAGLLMNGLMAPSKPK